MVQENVISDEIEIDLKELLLELLSHWKLLAAATVLTGGIVFLFSYFMITPKYESTSALYVLSKSTSITSLADVQMGTSLTNDYLVVVKARPVMEQVISNLDLQDTYKSLSSRVTVNNPSNSRILYLVVQDTDAHLAKEIADELAEVAAAFISEKMDQDPPTIIHWGYVDERPVSPNKVKNALIGAFAGLAVAGMIVTVLYLINDTIMTSEDVERKLGLSVLGFIPYEVEEERENYAGEEKARRHSRKGA